MNDDAKKQYAGNPMIVDEAISIGLSNEEIAAFTKELRQFKEQENSGLALTAEQLRRRREINSIIFNNDKFKYFAYPFLMNTFPTYWAGNKDCLVNSAMAEFFANLHKYDGSVAISTFAKVHLRHGAQMYVSFFEKKGSYDNENWIRVSRAISRLISQHLYENADDIPAAKLAQETGLTTAQIANLLDVNRGAAYCNLETGAANVTTKQWVPEIAMEQKESDEAAEKMLSSLPEIQRFVLTARLGIDCSKLSFQEIGCLPRFVQIVKDAGYSYLIKKGTVKVKKTDIVGEYIPSKDVISFYEQATLHLRQDSNVQKRIGAIRSRMNKEVAGLTSYSTIVENDEFAVLESLAKDADEIIIFRNKNKANKKK